MCRSDEDLLRNISENDIISEAYVALIMNKKKRQAILKNHKYRVYQEKSGQWATYLPSATRGRILKRKKTRDELEDCIVEYYDKYRTISVEDVFYEWIESKMQYGEIQKQTYDRYIIDYCRYIKPTYLNDMDIGTVKEDDIESFIKRTIRDNNLNNKAYSGIRTIIRGTFKYAKKHKYSTISIAQFFGDLELSKKIFSRNIKRDDEQVFTDTEVIMIQDYVMNHLTLENLGVLLVFYTGLRIGEMSALRKEDIVDNKLSIERTEIRYKEGNNYIYEVRDNAKTEAGERTIYLNSNAIAIINRIKLMNPFGEWLFERNDKRIKAHSFDNAIYRICKSLNIKKRSMHKARKTFATKLLNANVSERLITLQMGHTDISCTKNYYFYNNKEEEIARKEIDEALIY